jgi:cyclic pyranopterin phosphate synthase
VIPIESKILIDSHKLNYHPVEVGKWLQGKTIYPICIEISPSGTCNHRCIFCSQSYLGYQRSFINQALLLENMKELVRKGTKSIVVAGEGEPLLHKETPNIINHIKSLGMDVAMSTNGVLMTREITQNCLASLTWVRISLNGGNQRVYNEIHGLEASRRDYDKVLGNLETMVAVKRQQKLMATIGVQLVLIPGNFDGLIWPRS